MVTWTAANGDEITIVNTAEIGEVGVDGSASISITSDVTGTGRFENVSFPGSEQLAGRVWFFDESGASGHIEAGLDSTILFDASDRRN